MNLDNLTIDLRQKKALQTRSGFSRLKLWNKLKSNGRALILLAANSEPKALRRYYRTWVYRRMKKMICAFASFQEILPRLSIKALSVVAILSLISVQVLNLTAYEAHVINVTARIENDVPDIDPEGGQFCDLVGADVVLSTSAIGAEIIYTLDGSDPTCPDDSPSEFTYTDPFHLIASALVKARSCHGGKQSVIAEAFFDIKPEYCPAYCGDGKLDPGEECDDGNNINGDGCSADCRKECIPDKGEFCTQTQGGWGAKCAGKNAGCLLRNNWAAVIGGGLVLGGIYTITLADSDAVKNYLPDGGKPDSLDKNYINPLSTNSGVLGGQVTALKINVLFGDAHIGLITPTSPLKLGELKIATGTFAGMTVYDFLALAEAALGGETTGLDMLGADLSDLVDAAAKINENFGDCKVSKGYLVYPECLNACVPQPETCNGRDDDCDGKIDNNAYENISTSSPPDFGALDNMTEVTNKVKSSNNIYAYQPVYDTNYIYLDWHFPLLPGGLPINLAKLTLEHMEYEVEIAVEWWNGLAWIGVCDPAEAAVDTIDTCNLLPFIDTTDKAKDVKIRLVLNRTGSCHEKLDWAELEIGYKQEVNCYQVCGDGEINLGEQCDDGNSAGGDGCSDTCRFENDRCLKINEVYYDPDSCHGNYKDEWIEIYNTCQHEINLKNWYMEDNGGLADKEIFGDVTVGAGQYAVVAADNATFGYWTIPSGALKIALGGVRLFGGLGNSSDHIFLYDDNGNLVDAVGYGTDISAFAPAVPDVSKGHSISRKPAGHDTDTAADWFNTYSGSSPPGPNPGTNPHNSGGDLLVPEKVNPALVCCDNGEETLDNSDEGLTDGEMAALSAQTDENPVLETGAAGLADSEALDVGSGLNQATENDSAGTAFDDSPAADDNDAINLENRALSGEISTIEQLAAGPSELTMEIESKPSEESSLPAVENTNGGEGVPAIIEELALAPSQESAPSSGKAPDNLINPNPLPSADNPAVEAPPASIPAPVETSE